MFEKANSQNVIIAPTTSDDISDLINNLKSSKSVGSYSIPTKIMKIFKETISLPLSQLINGSISKGSFTNICKLAQVISNFKNDSRLLCANHRPISLLSNIRKTIENVIHIRLNFFLEQHNHLHPYQFGFRIDYSTNDALMAIVERIQKQLDAGNYTARVFVDLRKAFDTVGHNILLEKLDYYGIRGVAKDWFRFYLANRKRYVTLNGSSSSMNPILTGVPQGSFLGPLLFLININDLCKCVEYSETYHFPDDTDMLQSHSSLETLAKRMNLDLKNLSQ